MSEGWIAEFFKRYGAGLPLTAVLLGALSGWALRFHYPDIDNSIRQGLGDQAPWWLVMSILVIAWWLVLSATLEFARWVRGRYVIRKRREARAAIRSARPTRLARAADVLAVDGRRAAYDALSDDEKVVLCCFIDAGVRTLGGRRLMEELEKATRAGPASADSLAAATRRLLERRFLFHRPEDWERSSQYSLGEQGFRELSEHPDWIGSSAPVRLHLE